MKKLLLILILAGAAQLSQAQQKSAPPAEREQSVRMIRFYPNPAISEITFEFDRGYDQSYTFQIFNFLGKKVHEITKVTPKNKVNLNDFFRGVYIFQLKDKDGRVLESGKFQVAK